MTVTCPLYDAEAIAWPRHAVFSQLVSQPQKWLDHITQTCDIFWGERAKANLPEDYVTITWDPKKPGGAYAEPELQSVVLARNMVPSQGLLIHELTHLCVPADAYHDRRYCAVYLRLTRAWLGELAATELLNAMRKTGAF